MSLAPHHLRNGTSYARDALNRSRFMLAALLIGAYAFMSLAMRIVLTGGLQNQ